MNKKENFNLPEHVERLNSSWYRNNKTGKFLHVNIIADFCDRYWAAQAKINEARAAKYSLNLAPKLAKRRWDDEK